MYFYRLRKLNDSPLPPQLTLIFSTDYIDFIEVPSLDFVSSEFNVFNSDADIKTFSLVSSLDKGVYSYYDSNGEKQKRNLTKEEIDVAFKLKKEIILIKIKEHFRRILEYAFNELNVEKNTWERQKTEADLFKSTGNDKGCDFIKTLAKVRNIPLEELVDKILNKAEKYALFVATKIGEQHNIEKEVEKASTNEELNNIKILPDECKI